MISLYAFNHGDGLMEIEVEFLTFPGGEEHVKLDPASLNTRHHLVIDARVGSASDLLRVLVLNDAVARLSGAFTTLFIPYLPGARQDRGAPLTARVYADLINSMDFDQVIAVDPHSDVMPALIKKLDIIPATAVFPAHVLPDQSRTTLITPDQGACKRVEEIAGRFGFTRLAYARKHRDFATGKLSGFSIEPIYTSQAIMVDDICDGGGTFIGLAEEIIRVQARTLNPMPHLHLWTTHGIYSKGMDELGPVFKRIVSTDSFPHNQWAKIAGRESKIDLPLTTVPLLPILEAHLESTRYT